eukprot:GGOE01062315.1.p1 GENE.GGOE01062315.1~~GGOE01062315.1.p1  ORF type:complete len:1429 (-),score=496.78 GGOE01062315.1:79-4365(-)
MPAKPNASEVAKPPSHFVEPVDLPRRVATLQFSLLSSEMLRNLSHVQVTNRELYNVVDETTGVRQPVVHGPLDLRLGVSDKSRPCKTCGHFLQDCIGHWGYIKLQLPVFHIGFFNETLSICRKICKDCGKVLLNEEERRKYLRLLRKKDLHSISRKGIARKVEDLCKKKTECPWCGATNGNVRKLQQMRMAHEKYKVKHREETAEEFVAMFSNAADYNADLKPHIGKAMDDLTPLVTLNLFDKMEPEDIELLDMSPALSHPRDLIVTHMGVPPSCIRPSVPASTFQAGSTEDDLTMKLGEILQYNRQIAESIEKGAPFSKVTELWDFLQLLCAGFVDANLPGFPPRLKPEGKSGRALVQRLKGKTGRFRGNLSGKRVNFTGRTVISPDPNLEVFQVAVPKLVAKKLTYPQRVFEHNLDKLKSAVRNGPDVWPGAHYVYVQGDKSRQIWLKYTDCNRAALQLKVGDIVERHLWDGDYVLFNRQPSLHKLSIMAHEAKVLPYRTFRFNECCCSPYNADFDGDEMNLHLPQTEEARADAAQLMSVRWNLVTPRNGEPMISATQDFLTAAYLMTRKDTFFDRPAFCSILSYMELLGEDVTLPMPTIFKPMELWTGKQVFSFLICPNKRSGININFEGKIKAYSGKKGFQPYSMCVNDGWVLVRKSELISGIITKAFIGGGAKEGLFYSLIVNVSPHYSAKCMARLSRMTSRWLQNYGFSIGINDVTPSTKLLEEKQKIMDYGYKKCDEYISTFNAGKLEASPGCTTEQTLESKLEGELSKIRAKAGDMCVGELHWTNSPLIMTMCGSKGSPLNISQMISCVGQQTLNGKRIGNGFVHRSLPHFPKFCRDPVSRGFVANSFYSGITPTEFWFHTICGREGLIDTAVKTAETGYMQRRLMKALEDLSVQYDETVRNSEGMVVQLKYGDDCLDPTYMEGVNGKPINFDFLWLKISTQDAGSQPQYLWPWEVLPAVQELLDRMADQNLFSNLFKEELRQFWAGLEKRMEDALNALGLPHTEAALQLCEPDPVLLAVSHRIFSVTKRQVKEYHDACVLKHIKYKIDPGTACGALGATSIGEPATQMTLKTFHFAGIASMNITQGVPRIREIINAVKAISTPIIKVTLENPLDLVSARIVKARIEQTFLGEICRHISEVYAVGQCYLAVQLDQRTIFDLHLDVTATQAKQAILELSKKRKLRLEEKSISVRSPSLLWVYPTNTTSEEMFNCLQNLKQEIPNAVVQGLNGVLRAVIAGQDGKDGKQSYGLLVEGTDLTAVMGVPGVLATHTSSNHIIVVHKVLGVEAARSLIINEITGTMSSYGLGIDVRHVQQLADVMTFKGPILGIQRHGIMRMKDSVLTLASFERTTDVLFDAAVRARKDHGIGVSESIILGMNIHIGSGSFKLLQKVDRSNRPPVRKPLLSALKTHHVDVVPPMH